MGQACEEAFSLYSTKGLEIPEALRTERILDQASLTL